MIHQQFKTAQKVVAKEAPRELLHRAASYTIISEAIFHTFSHRLILVVVAGILFLVVEVRAIIREQYADKDGGAF